VSVACVFFLGRRYADIAVVTEPASRGRGFSTACAAAVAGQIRADGRRPTWTTSPDNAASLGVAARLGFVHARDDVLYAVRTPIPLPG
jgi:predicted GNAT family acetyltransferase